jgi:hypothetical protein
MGPGALGGRQQFVEADVDDLNRHATLAKQLSNTFLRVAASSIFDTRGNPLIAINDGSAIQVSTFIADAVPPTFTAFSLNMTSEQLILSFYCILVS